MGWGSSSGVPVFTPGATEYTALAADCTSKATPKQVNMMPHDYNKTQPKVYAQLLHFMKYTLFSPALFL